jgi:maltooligosyltrehalose trehalohydrolase
VNLDAPGADSVRAFIIDNALMWLDTYRFDGIRLDAIHAFHDSSAIHLLEELRERVDRFQHATGRRVDLIAESDLNDTRVVRPTELGGYAMDAQWSDDFHHALHALLTGERIGYYQDFGAVAQLAKAYAGAFVRDGGYCASRDRRHGRPTTGMHAKRFLAYAQNHDQIGNRARGERLAHLLSQEQLEIAAALVLLSPFVPMLFQGEEWASAAPFQYFTDHPDPALAQAVREGRRSEFAAFVDDPDDVPDPQDISTFERSVLDWSEPNAEAHARILAWHKRLIRFRNTHADLAPSPLEATRVRFGEEPSWMRVRRGVLVLVFNLSPDPQRIELEEDDASDLVVLLSNDRDAARDDGRCALGPWRCAVLGPRS